MEVARQNGVFIPSLCDHPRLAPFSGCRLCIVEVKGRRGYPPSCGTYIQEGMEIHTDTPKLRKLRKAILELILTEHPNACLICSEKESCDEFKSTIRKTGEVTGCVLCFNNNDCELQDVSKVLKVEKVHFPSVYRNLDIKKEDPFFDRNYNLCILCGRCVRICHEVRGASTLSFVYRGSQTVIGTVLDKPLTEAGCQFCGACVDVCPTGALAERAIKYESLPGEKTKTICPLCSIGCEIELIFREGKILSSRPSNTGAVNKGQACVKGRFVIGDIVHAQQRILLPLIRKGKKLEEASWEEALNYIVQSLKKFKRKDIILVASPQATCEDSYVFQRFAHEVLNVKNISSTASLSPLAAYQVLAVENGLKPLLNFKIEDLSKATTLFLMGTDIPVSHPIIWLEVLKAVNNGARLVVVSPVNFSINRYASLWLQAKPGTEYLLFGFLSRIILEREQTQNLSRIEGFSAFRKSLEGLNLSQSVELTGVEESLLKKASETLLKGEPAVFLFGTELTQSGSRNKNMAALWNLALQTRSQLFPLVLENNVRGYLKIGQHFQKGKIRDFNQSLQELSESKKKALYLSGPIHYPAKTQAEFLIVQDSFMNETANRADVVLPTPTFAETEGTFINVEGRVQKTRKIIEPLEESRPEWWIFSALARKMDYKGLDFKKPSEIIKEIRKTIPGFEKTWYSSLQRGKEIFIQEGRKGREKFVPLKFSPMAVETSKKYPFLLRVVYSLDYYKNLVLSQEIKGLRRIRNSRWIKICLEDAEKLKLKEGNSIVLESFSGEIKGVVKISDSLPKGMAEAQLLWNEESLFSASHLVFPFSKKRHSLSLVPVKIKRGSS